MDGKYINKNRYKSISRSNKEKRDIKIEKSVREKAKINIKTKNNKLVHKTKIKSDKTEVKKIYKEENTILKLVKITFSVLLLVGIGYLSKILVLNENAPLKEVFSSKEEISNLENEYSFKIGVASLGEKDILKNNNIIVNEVVKSTMLPLIKVDSEYNIEYVILESVEKVSNTEYLLKLKENVGVTVDDVVTTINIIKGIGDNNPYYNNISNIDKIVIENEKIKIVLKNIDPYYIYRLNIPIYSSSNFNENNLFKITNESITNQSISFLKNDNANLNNLSSVTINEYNDTDKMVSEFVNGNIDMFLTSSYSVMQMLGKYEYNIKKVRSGETIFLLGNTDSVIFKQEEIRKAIAFSINKEDVIKSLEAVYADPIDIPYIYSSNKYKYDITGAENLLIANSWKKSGGVYQKNIEGQNVTATLTLIVNINDTIKVNVAEKIKEMAQNIGIRINIEKYTTEEMQKKVENKEYDLVLSTLSLNENLDITFLKKYININEETNNIFLEIENSDINNLKDNSQKLMDYISSKVLAIGIFANNINIVYQKYINGFEENLEYMNIFKNFKNIGKVVKQENE